MNNQKIATSLSQIGLTPGETKVYLALLKKGPQTRNAVSKHAKVSSSKTYEITEKLLQKGLVSHYEKNHKKYFQALSPEILNSHLEKKQEELEKQKKILSNIIPILKNQEEKEENPKFQIYEGWKGLKNAELEAINEMSKNSTIKGIGAQFPKPDFLSTYHKIRKDKKIKAKIILTEDYKESSHIKDCKTKKIPGLSKYGLGIYDKRITIETYEKEPILISIKHPIIKDFFEAMFEKLWNSK